MIGAIIGDIVGSRFEFIDHSGKDFPLFEKGCCITDDTLMTLAVACALFFSKGNYSELGATTIETMKYVAEGHENAGWGGMFYKWLFEGQTRPMHSYGNGAGMRISPVGWIADSEKEVKELSAKITEISHNHPEGMKGAEAIAMAVYLARIGVDKQTIRHRMAEYYPKLNDTSFRIKNIMGKYGYDEDGAWVTCQGSIPQALIAFFDGNNFEDVIRNAVGIGGDSDTIGAMAGSIAEAYYGVPVELEEQALEYLDSTQKNIYYAFNKIKKPRIIR